MNTTPLTDDTDTKARDAVEAELGWAPEVPDAADIGVAVHNGVVTLSGKVTTYGQKIAAGKAALRTRGVTAVANDLIVTFGGAQHDDAELAERARNTLRWNIDLPRDAIDIEVREGVVTLTGSLEWDYQRLAARHAIESLTGVKRVVDQVTLQPRASSDDTMRQIRKAFHRMATVDSDHIKVAVDGTKVTLSGTVSSYVEKQAAARAAWSSPHVTQVVNDLRIQVG